MEPVLGGRDDQHRLARGQGGGNAAMEPVLGGRDDALEALLDYVNPAQPQWSPSLADGTTGARSRSRHRRRRRRNGARPWRTGRPNRPGGTHRRSAGRNGARPWRTGRRPGSSEPAARIPTPQWSPSLADGTTRIRPSGRRTRVSPQWSPSLADGTTIHVWPGDAVGVRPQWSPSLADGTTGKGTCRHPPAI